VRNLIMFWGIIFGKMTGVRIVKIFLMFLTNFIL